MTALLRFHKDALLAQLNEMRPQQRARFAVECARRLTPCYERYHNESGKGDVNALHQFMTIATDALADRSNPQSIETAAAQCQQMVPDEDEDWTSSTGGAQNAVIALTYALRCLASGDAQDAVWAAVQGYEAADRRASTELDIDFNVSGSEDRVLAHPAVQSELQAQRDSLERLSRP
ncbi:MAG: hypothetical protein QOK28_1263 [Actinomycetota bacterium]|jgi:uncharacterized protein YjaG (DUF416 family)